MIINIEIEQLKYFHRGKLSKYFAFGKICTPHSGRI